MLWYKERGVTYNRRECTDWRRGSEVSAAIAPSRQYACLTASRGDRPGFQLLIHRAWVWRMKSLHHHRIAIARGVQRAVSGRCSLLIGHVTTPGIGDDGSPYFE